jgi:hypothetical protein
MNKLRDLKVIGCVDFMGTSMGGPEEEYKQMQETLSYVFPDVNVIFSTVVNPAKLVGKEYDMFILDFGGLMPGCDGLIEYTHRDTIRQIVAFPKRLFIMYSSFTYRDFKAMVEDEFPQLITFNVIFWQDDDARERARQFFDLPAKAPTPDFVHKLITPGKEVTNAQD